MGRQPKALRFAPALWNAETRQSWPAIVAAITSAEGKTVAIHRTWLREDGYGKAPVPEPKLTLGRYAGGAIRLWRGASRKPLAEAPAGETVVVGEGLEDCLSSVVARPDLRVLCAVAMANMGGMVLPPAIARVLILKQNDKEREAIVGLKRAIRNFQAQGKSVGLVESTVGKDVNDLLRAPAGKEDAAPTGAPRFGAQA